MTKQQQSTIIGLVVNIFQNVGIKRCIDKIDILKNYQIYFEICKVIFPQTMIQLLRFSQGSQTNSQKIQAVIDIVSYSIYSSGKILQNDLYHISGQAIAQGKLAHIRNFLHILQLLSQNVHKGNRNQSQVQSAPQNTRSDISDYDQQSHYTVIGINKQFQRQYDDEDHNQDNYQENYGQTSQDNYDPNHELDLNNPQQRDVKKQYQKNINQVKSGNNQIKNNNQTKNGNSIKNGKQNQYQQQQSDNEDSQSEKPMNPILNKKDQSSKKRFIKTKPKQKNNQKIIIHQIKPKSFIKPHLIKKQPLNYPQLQNFVKRKQINQEIRKKVKSTYVRKINNIIQEFQAKKLTDLKLDYNIWVKKHQIKTNQKQNQIEQENKQRMLFANQLIFQRKNKINTLTNAKQAIDVMANLFKQQRNIWKGMKKAQQENQLQLIQSIIHHDQRDQDLLRQALMAGNPQYIPQKRR